MSTTFISPASAETAAKVRAQSWPAGLRVIFRFLFCYLCLKTLPQFESNGLFGGSALGEAFAKGYLRATKAVVLWVGNQLLHLPTVNRPPEGDTTFGYVQTLICLVLAAATALIWSLVDWHRPHYRVVYGWWRVWLRWSLCFSLIPYGITKLFLMQFGPPPLAQYIQPLGQLRPMSLLWTFMGASPAYVFFSGLVEVTGSLLLLFRRTALLGALICTAALVNVVLLNACYGVNVKIYSFHLLVIAVVLVVPDMPRLTRLLVLNRPVGAPQWTEPTFASSRLQIAFIAVGIFVAVFHLYSLTRNTYDAAMKWRFDQPQPPLYGLFEVETFQYQGQDRPPLLTDPLRWRRVAVERPMFLQVQLMDDTLRSFRTTYEEKISTVILVQAEKQTQQDRLSYSSPDPDHVELRGTLRAQPVTMRLRRIPMETFALWNREFRWVINR